MNSSESETDEGLKATVVGHVLIRDKETGDILLNQRDLNNSPKDSSDASDR